MQKSIFSMRIILFYLVHISRLWPNIKVCSNFIKTYYMCYFYVLIIIMCNQKRLGGNSLTLKRTVITVIWL